MTPLGEILTERQQTPSIDAILAGDVPIVSKIGFDEGRIELRDTFDTKTGMIQIEPGDLVVSGINAAKGAIAIYGEENHRPIAATIHYAAYIPNKDKADIHYLWWFLRSGEFRRILNRHLPGGIKTELKASRLLPISIPLPPFSEQRRIVAKIEQLAAKIEQARDLQEHSRVEVDSFLNAAYRRAFELQKHWKTTKVAHFCEKPQYGYTASAIYEPVGPKFLRITDIQNGKVNWDTVPYCHCEEPEKYILEDEDLIFARTGATTGKSFLVKNCPKAIFASYLIRLRVKQMVSVEYLYKFFQSPVYWSQITADKRGTGQPNFNGKKLANLWISVPPIDEQHQIVSYLDDIQAKVDNLGQLQEQTTAELDALLPSILNKAFKGEL